MSQTTNLSIFERMLKVNPETEIWWDSSPLIYQAWAKEFISSIEDGDKKRQIEDTLSRFYNPDAPQDTFFRGVTTNPPLSLNVLKYHKQAWEKFAKRIHRISPDKRSGDMFWQMYKEIVRGGAELFLPVFEKSDHTYGYISAQLDPRDRENYDIMLRQAEELASLSPNVMIKVPGTNEGYQIIKTLTSRGIATNNTLAFMIPQFTSCMQAVKEGLQIAKKNEVDLSCWRSVITFMSARFTSLGTLQQEAQQKGINLTEEDIRWAELAIMKKAYGLLHKENHPSKMLLCSMRISPTVGWQKRCWHLEKLAGADMVFTCPPKFIGPLLLEADHIQLSDQIDEPVPEKVLDKLLKIDYFARGYDEKGYTPEEFNFHPAVFNTGKQFSGAVKGMIDFARENV